jgi:hypothetical protein
MTKAKSNLWQTSPDNTKKQQEDAVIFMKEQSEETQEQQTKDKFERWMAQVRVDRPEEVIKWSTDSSRVFLSSPDHAVRALQATEEARKSAKYSQTQRDVESRRRSWGSTAGEEYADFTFHVSEYELDFYVTY